MNFFIDSASAQAAGGGSATSSNPLIGGVLPLIVIFVLFYFLLIRPQTKRQKEHKQMLEALGTGDEVVTGGGLLGKVTAVGDQFVTVEFADGVAMKVQKSTISAVMPKGTLKNA
ncbi:MAG TPA: preprotein translocase subunit YajC [Gammaproteobacteria bacterium]|nr:preprotein translocase subunit YajC [Gammaproteobacteria bacterium]